MYFNNIPPAFGQPQMQNPQALLNKPILGYNQGIGGLPTPAQQNMQASQNAPQNPAQAAPQLGNVTPPTATASGLGGKSITPLMPYDKGGPGQRMAEGGGVRREEPSYYDYVATMARNAADKATGGAYKYGQAGADYSYDALMDMLGYENDADYDRSLAEAEYALRRGEEETPVAAAAGDVAGYTVAGMTGLSALGDYGKKAYDTAALLSKGYAAGGVVGRTLAMGGVVSEGIAALRGQHPDPRSALAAYDEQFGPEATAELMRSYAEGGVVSGPGSGVADLIPGTIDGREDVRIASGEYVIPAWAVATLGDGSTEAGARLLDAMVARLREAGSELIKGTDPINPNEFLPA